MDFSRLNTPRVATPLPQPAEVHVDIPPAQPEFNHRRPELQHNVLRARSDASSSLVGVPPPRTVLVGSPEVTTSGRRRAVDESTLLPPDGERSDYFSVSESLHLEIESALDQGSARFSDQMPPNAIAETFTPPPPTRSWRETLAAARDSLANVAAPVLGALGAAAASGGGVLAAGLGHAGAVGLTVAGHAGQSLRELPQAFGLLAPNMRLAGAAAGHVMHQTVTVGLPTLGREMLAEAMLLSLRHMPPDHVVLMQVGMGAVNILAQILREARERRDPDAAACGFHALSAEEWAAKTPEEQAGLRAIQVKHSRMVMAMALACTTTNVGMGILGSKTGRPELANNALVADVKTLVYSSMRDGLQASFGLVGFDGRTKNGVSGEYMTSSAVFYGAANISGNFAWGTLPALAGDADEARGALRGDSSSISSADAWKVLAAVSSVKAAINTAVEASDWFSVTQHEATQAGTTQKFEPALKGRAQDYGRLLDQTPARMVAIGAGNASGALIAYLTRDLPASVAGLIGNVATGALAGIGYKTIGGTWQAGGAVRAATAEGQHALVRRPTMRR